MKTYDEKDGRCCIAPINVAKYKVELSKLSNTINHLVEKPDDFTGIVKFMRRPNTNDVMAIIINGRISIRNMIGVPACGELKCRETIKCDKNGIFHIEYFSFHFEVKQELSKYKTFRLDYNPKSITILHAHDNEYEKTNEKHYEYPSDTDLKLHFIDFITVMYVISHYMQKSDCYPLENGSEYNKITKKIRSRYDD